jgi:hypothetical protein
MEIEFNLWKVFKRVLCRSTDQRKFIYISLIITSSSLHRRKSRLKNSTARSVRILLIIWLDDMKDSGSLTVPGEDSKRKQTALFIPLTTVWTGFYQIFPLKLDKSWFSVMNYARNFHAKLNNVIKRRSIAYKTSNLMNYEDERTNAGRTIVKL